MGASYATYYRLQSTIVLSFVRSPPKQSFSCPGSYCSWKPFSTLAVCGSYKNVTDQVRRNCTYTEERKVELLPGKFSTIEAKGICSYRFPGLDTSSKPYTYDIETKYDGYISFAGTDLLLAAVKGSNRSSIEFNILKVHNQTKLELNKPARFGAYTVGWHWCAKTFHNLSASQGELHIGTTISEALQLQTQDDIDDPASLYYEDDRYLTDWNTSSSSTLYRTLPTPFWDHINDWLGDAALKWGSPAMNDEFGGGKEAGNVIYTADMAQMVDNVASALSSLVWSNETDNLSAEKFPGDAFVTESYIHVRWQWITAVLVEALLAAALLVASIIAVRGDPLLKASVIALLVHGLEDWRDIEVLQPETSATLEESSEEVVVRLMDNGAGRRLFVKQATE